MSSNILNFINSVVDKDYSAANNMFDDIIGEKIQASLEDRKQEVAQNIYKPESE